MTRIYIEHITSYIPSTKIDNRWVEEKIQAGGFPIQEGLLEKMIGSETRYYAEADEQVSDLAVAAAMKLLQKIPGRKIDLLIFAAASSDLIEPATANIVQHKLGLQCACFDLKNACNSVPTLLKLLRHYCCNRLMKMY